MGSYIVGVAQIFFLCCCLLLVNPVSVLLLLLGLNRKSLFHSAAGFQESMGSFSVVALVTIDGLAIIAVVDAVDALILRSINPSSPSSTSDVTGAMLFGDVGPFEFAISPPLSVEIQIINPSDVNGAILFGASTSDVNGAILFGDVGPSEFAIRLRLALL
ncbi:hypothetical protein Acr_10g0005750 [Actinidia rufa]|uniref:Uncharacterized protein n=1 Tax=Actinidia rufa TaxID=165716 RepID=A0A7J0F904_9ERIC|nr:hypothetical protein Acr_10g0005750 [Actinidia rufa]